MTSGFGVLGEVARAEAVDLRVVVAEALLLLEGLDRCPGELAVAVGRRGEEEVAEVDLDHAAARRQGTDPLVVEIALEAGGEVPAGGVRGDQRRARESAIAWSNASSETCEMSTIMPSRFISATTSRPNGERPRHRRVSGGE